MGAVLVVSCHYEAGALACFGWNEPSGEESDPLCWVLQCAKNYRVMTKQLVGRVPIDMSHIFFCQSAEREREGEKGEKRGTGRWKERERK